MTSSTEKQVEIDGVPPRGTPCDAPVPGDWGNPSTDEKPPVRPVRRQGDDDDEGRGEVPF